MQAPAPHGTSRHGPRRHCEMLFRFVPVSQIGTLQCRKSVSCDSSANICRFPAPMEQTMIDYHDGQRRLQDHFDTRRLADRLDQTVVHDVISPDDRAFIESRDFFFLSTVDAAGQPNCSFKAGPTGFVRVLDDRTIAFPSYDGNGMFMSMGNLLANPKLGMLFIDFERPNRLRFNGSATIDLDDPLRGDWPGADFIVRVTARQLFPNCPRYIPRFQRVADSPNIPQAGQEAPFANWKQIDFIRDSLPAPDLAKVSALPTITIEDFIASIK